MGTDDTGEDSFIKRSFMQVIKNKKGTFFREKVYVDGKAIHSPRFARKTDALNWKAKMMTGKASYQSTGIMPKAMIVENAITLSDYAMTWLDTRVKLQLAPRTYDHYLHSLKRHILPRFGKLNLHEIRLNHSDRLIQELSEAGHNARGVNLIIGIFKRVLIEAVKENRIEKNPFQYLKELKEPPRPDVYLSGEEINKILEASKGNYFHSLFLVGINTGMRRGELAGLCWDKVNFETSLIEISRLRDRSGLGDRTKTVKSRRFIPMNAVVKHHLMGLKKSSEDKQVFLDEDNDPFDVDHLYRDLRVYLKGADIDKTFRFHDLRHTFASHFMMNGGNIYDLQKILGHTSLEMTQRYAHLAPEHLVRASNVVSFGSHFEKAKLEFSAYLAPSSIDAS
jgi:integrase